MPTRTPTFATTGDTRLEPRYQAGHIFFVDSVAALADAQQGRAPQGEFAALVDLLTRQFAGAAAARIRRANFLDLAAQALESCRRRLDEAMPAIENLRAAIDQQRGELSSALAGQIRGELLSARRPWENRLLGQVASRWGFSPFSLVLRLYQGIGGLASGALLYRARTPAQLALWGVVEGARTWQKHRRNRQLQQRPGQAAAGGFDATQLRRAAVVLEGYAAEAGLPKASASVATLEAEADAASLNFAARLSQDLDALIARQAERHTGWFTRWRYEILLLAMLGFLLFRLGKNFFYDSWWLVLARADVGRGVVYRLGLLARALVFPVALAVHAAIARRAEAGRRPPGRELDRGHGRRRRLRTSWKTIAAGPSSSGGNWRCFKATWSG